MEFILDGKTETIEDKSIIPEGLYFVWIVDDPKTYYVSRRETPNGNKYLSFNIQLLSGGSQAGKKFFESYFLSPNALWRVQNLYFAIQKDEAKRISKFDMGDDDLIHHALYYRPFAAKIVHREYNGKVSLSLDAVYPLTEEDVEGAYESAEELLASGRSGKGPRERNPYSK